MRIDCFERTKFAIQETSHHFAEKAGVVRKADLLADHAALAQNPRKHFQLRSLSGAVDPLKHNEFAARTHVSADSLTRPENPPRRMIGFSEPEQSTIRPESIVAIPEAVLHLRARVLVGLIVQRGGAAGSSRAQADARSSDTCSRADMF